MELKITKITVVPQNNDQVKVLAAQVLNRMMKAMVRDEEYEKAAMIRDAKKDCLI